MCCDSQKDDIEKGPGLPESKSVLCLQVTTCVTIVPSASRVIDKPRYLMGVGYPLDLVVCVALGVDMFDCVWPCKTSSFVEPSVGATLLRIASFGLVGGEHQ